MKECRSLVILRTYINISDIFHRSAEVEKGKEANSLPESTYEMLKECLECG